MALPIINRTTAVLEQLRLVPKNVFYAEIMIYCLIVRIPATSYLVPLFTLIYLVLFHLLPPYHLDVPCYLNNRQRYCSVWSERLGLFTHFEKFLSKEEAEAAYNKAVRTG